MIEENTFLDFDIEKRKKWESENLPYAVVLELTPRCNLSCVHCYLRNCHGKPQMTYQRIIEILDILYEKGILFLTMTGGEVFVRSDFLDIYLYAKRKGFIIELFSNGVLLNDEILSVLKKYPPLRIDVSIYGSGPDTYKKVTGSGEAFDKLIQNCHKMVDAQIRLTLKSPIITLNQDEIDGMKKIADELGVIFIPTFEIISSIEKEDISKQYQISIRDSLKFEFNEREKAIKNGMAHEKGNKLNGIGEESIPLYNCKVGKNSFVIDYNGNMCPCMKMRHRGVLLRYDNFDEIWSSFNKLQCSMSGNHFKCIKCNFRYYCEACSGEMEFLHGDPEYRDADTCRIALVRKSFYEDLLSSDEAVGLLSDNYLERG